MRRYMPLLLLTMIFCVACTSTKDKNNKRLESEENHPIDSMNSSIEIIADQLQTPWSIQKSGDVFYLAERPGSIVKIAEETVDRQQIILKKELSSAPEAGLLGFVLALIFLPVRLPMRIIRMLRKRNNLIELLR